MSITGSLPRKWSMRRICSSSSTSHSSSFSFRAESRSWPKGFSSTTRAFSVSPAPARFLTTVPNSDGGISR